jgi:7-carboxy-7-deazaguanine synthase
MAPLRSKIYKDDLLVHEIYTSVQGESSYMGLPCIFIRTTGCHLRCSYCDTEHAFFKGNLLSIDSIISHVASFGIKVVELTGGEPLLQKASFVLLDRLVEEKYTVLLETSGAVSIKNINKNVKVILDIKTPSSLESEKYIKHNLDILWPGCEVKFVIGSLEDYNFAKSMCETFNLYERTHVLFSPVIALFDPAKLADLIVADRLSVRFQIQLHRVLFGEAQGK